MTGISIRQGDDLMTRVHVNPEILEWAVKRSGKSLEAIKKNFPKFEYWMKREELPTFKQLEKFANFTFTPFGYFFLKEPPEEKLPIPLYRTKNDSVETDPSVNLKDTVYTMERRQDWMREYLIDNEEHPLKFVGKYKITDDYLTVAEDIRRTLGLKKGWAAECKTWQEAFRLFIRKVEEQRIIVVINGVVGNNNYRKLDVNEFRGFVLVDEYAPLIFINGADGKAAQMFTLAHELAHVWFGASAAFDLESLQPADANIEEACNRVAAEFLVPEKELLDFWPEVREEPDRFQLVARYFKVSEIVSARRALDLKLITKNEFFEFYQSQYVNQQRENRESSDGNFYYTSLYRVGRVFAEAVINAVKDGQLLHHEAYRLTGLQGKTFIEFAERLGFGGNGL
ncbi:putative Zn peptidase [Caldibacillus debilis GB1]|jgi:Zn-dependent peptidase ImmA (M78 family)|uniref:Putative Zn peptidase n=3 Tax=Caldibacillus debilis TaxID=301148 RepID=A0A420VDF7_9BACI|nr:putative Zn peptidase [Caldibacillus debilis GB1]